MNHRFTKHTMASSEAPTDRAARLRHQMWYWTKAKAASNVALCISFRLRQPFQLGLSLCESN